MGLKKKGVRVHFYKYHGNGNDFILIDNRRGEVKKLSRKTIEKLCHRRLGIGADGLILMNTSKEYDFEMKYYNSDGRESTMCGNGGRCMVRFANDLGMIKKKSRFLAMDGPHDGIIDSGNAISIMMTDVKSFERSNSGYIINTGSPHFVKFVADVNTMEVFKMGREIRNQPEFAKEGINVNFVEVKPNELKVRTYERGVEDETLSCGTGVVASALIGCVKMGKNEGKQTIRLTTPGGNFEVSFLRKKEGFSDIWLKGGAEFVFNGTMDLKKFNCYK